MMQNKHLKSLKPVKWLLGLLLEILALNRVKQGDYHWFDTILGAL